MERSEALGGLIIALAALIVAVGIAVFVTAEGATPAQPPSGEELAGSESQMADSHLDRSRRERRRDRRAAAAAHRQAQDNRPEAAGGAAVETGAAALASTQMPSSVPTGDADRWESEDRYDDYDDRASGDRDDSDSEDGEDDSE